MNLSKNFKSNEILNEHPDAIQFTMAEMQAMLLELQVCRAFLLNAQMIVGTSKILILPQNYPGPVRSFQLPCTTAFFPL